MGDKLQQKMDSVTFAQERMKRQLKDLQEKVQGTPADVTDVKDRIEVWNCGCFCFEALKEGEILTILIHPL